jgi:hypothetical protein
MQVSTVGLGRLPSESIAGRSLRPAKSSSTCSRRRPCSWASPACSTAAGRRGSRPTGRQRRVRPDRDRRAGRRPGGAARPARQDPRPGPAHAVGPPHRSRPLTSIGAYVPTGRPAGRGRRRGGGAGGAGDVLGERYGVVADPFGHRWALSTPASSSPSTTSPAALHPTSSGPSVRWLDAR